MARSTNEGRDRVARRVVALILRLQGHRYMPPLRALVDHLGVSERTVCRYLDAIEQAGWPLPRRGWHKSEAA